MSKRSDDEHEIDRPAKRPIVLALLVIAIGGVHVLAAIYAWRLLPHGFPPSHARFWVNQVLPVALLASSAGCAVGVWRRWRVTAVLLAMFPGLHAGIAVGWSLTFPSTGGRVASIAGAVAAVLAVCVALALARSWRWLVAGFVVAALAGIGVARSQRGPDPATHPVEAVRALIPPVTAPPSGVEVDEATVRMQFDSVEIAIHPLLSFYSRSPDRGWTVFADQRAPDDVRGNFGVTAAADGVQITAETVVPEEVFSHLNSFCVIEVRGHRRLSLAFSPMPERRIEVTHSEYPTGKPSRFAYVDADGDVVAAEASSGEKGPFTELARGHLPAGAPLGITLFDGDRAIATIALADFAPQASTQLSPTAGWGVPENAIEINLAEDRPDAPAMLFLTLAGTSVGRGWDSVGHAPGVYRNRITVRR